MYGEKVKRLYDSTLIKIKYNRGNARHVDPGSSFHSRDLLSLEIVMLSETT